MKRKKFYLLGLINFIFIFIFIIIIISLTQKNKFKNILSEKCYSLLDNSNPRIIHLIITRFLIFFDVKYKKNNIHINDYILNGIRVMKKYLFPSLENQSCKNFTWVLILGNKVNITYIKSSLNINTSFKKKVIYQKDFKEYIRNITQGFDIFITTRIDYDDRIYYDAVNDVRKAININRPMMLYGYNKGLYYFEFNRKYYNLESPFSNNGVMSIIYQFNFSFK